ncbi:MAG: MotA/TolQ/ExbB proton channel family protein [Candidatus Omnitrophica bacterium]|nr:MotA/TolQ/ExbB proton channel family protein [Candidatus Omnitrophota bacterium]
MIRIKNGIMIFTCVLFSFCASSQAQDASKDAMGSFKQAARTTRQQLEESLAELNASREQIAGEQIPLSRKLNDLESELVNVRLEYRKTSRLLDSRTLDLSNLRSEIKSRQEETTYILNLLSEYIRNFEARMHISEIQRYQGVLETAKLAPENSNLSTRDIYKAQTDLLSASIERLHGSLGGTRFDGTAVDASGLVKHGTFFLVGPAALFQSQDGKSIGTVEQRLGSLEPAVISFSLDADTQAAKKLITQSEGFFPLDPTLGNAHKIEATKESLWQHVQNGGPVMVPIFGLASAALMVALYKWFALSTLRIPSEKQVSRLMQSISQHDTKSALQQAQNMGGVVGNLFSTGIEHINESRELIEEILYEKIMSTRLKLQSFLPFIAITASSAPLLGLLGTVTGIINTFKLITVFGSGDVKTLSGGISEALITTKFGLIVAIPSLLLHAFLSRKAKGLIDQMEKSAISFVNQVSKMPLSYLTRDNDPTVDNNELCNV